MMAFQGGNLDLADFQVTPPLGRSILKIKNVVNCTGESKVVVKPKKEQGTRCGGVERGVVASQGGLSVCRGQGEVGLADCG